MEQEAKAIKGYSAFSKAAVPEPHHHIVYYRGGLIPLHICSRCILQLQSTGLLLHLETLTLNSLYKQKSFTRVSQTFHNILVMWVFKCFCRCHENDEQHLTVWCRAHLMLSVCYSQVCLKRLKPILGIHDFCSTSSCRIIEIQTTWAKFLQPSIYTLLGLTEPLSFTRQIFWVVSPALCPNSKLESISFRI